MTSLDLVDSTKEATVQNYCLRAEIEWEYLFRTFPGRFRRKSDLGRLEKRMKQNRKRDRVKSQNLFNLGLRHVQAKKSLLVDNFSLRSQ